MTANDTIELREPHPTRLLLLLIGASLLGVGGCLGLIIGLEPTRGEDIAIGSALGWLALVAVVAFGLWRRFASQCVDWSFTLEGLRRTPPTGAAELFRWADIQSAQTGILQVDTMERRYLRLKLSSGRIVELGYAGLSPEMDAEFEAFALRVVDEVERRNRSANAPPAS